MLFPNMSCNCDSFPLDVAGGVLPALESDALLEVGLDLRDDKLIPGIHMWPFRVTTTDKLDHIECAAIL